MTKSTEPYADRGFSKHVTKIVVVLMILLMAFSFNFGGRAAREMADGGVTIGATRDGTRVSSVDRQYAARLLDTLEATFIQFRGQQAPLASVCWGRDVVAAFKKNPEALWLVLQESRRDGPGASPLTLGPLDADARSTQDLGIFNSGFISIDQLHPLPGSPLGALPPQARAQTPISILASSSGRAPPGPIAALAPLEQAAVYRALDDFLTIQSAASLAPAALKVSTPAVERFLAQRFQQFTLNVARLDASAFAAQAGEPTEAQVAGQFAKFAAFAPAAPTAGNPFGFGYRVGDRVKIEWIALDRAQVRGVVEAEKTPYQWEVEARIAYAKDPTAFAALKATTQAATTAPTTTTTTAVAAPAGFDAVKADAIALHVANAVDARLGEIERRIRSALTSDYQAYSVAKTTGATTQPATSVKLAIDDVGYLDAIAADVGRKSKMPAPRVVHLTDVARDRAELARVAPAFASLARAIAFDPSRPLESTGEPAMDYALRTAVAASTQPTAVDAQTNGLALYQPSETVSDSAGNTRAIFRVTTAKPSEPGTDLAAVRPRVVEDWKAAQAQSLAMKSAATAADAVRAGTLAVFSVPNTTFNAVTVGPLGQSVVSPPELGLAPDGFAQFNDAMGTSLLAGDPTGTPVAALDVPVARRVYVAQRVGMRPAWTTNDELLTLRDGARQFLATQMLGARDAQNAAGLGAYGIADAWVNVDRIFERTGWTASKGN